MLLIAFDRDRRGIVAIAGLAALAALLHLHFVLVDGRPPIDLGHVYASAMHIARGDPLSDAEGPYQLALGLAWRLFGRTRAVLDCAEILWMVVLVASLGASGRAAAGDVPAAARDAAGIVAAAAPLVFPLFPIAARTQWIHHPEVALCALALAIAAHATPTPAAGAAIGVVSFVGAGIRPSAIVWTTFPLLLWSLRARPSAPSIAAAWLPWAAAAAWAAPAVPGYVHFRVAGRAGQASTVGNPLLVLPVLLGALPGAIALVLSAAASGLGRSLPAAAFVGLAWLVAGAVVIAGTGAGPDNVPTAFAGLALLAASGAARVAVRPHGPAAMATIAAVLALGPATQLAPRLGALAPLTGWSNDDHALNWLVPRSGGARADVVIDAFDATCPAHGDCVVLLERGLVHPSWEDDGALLLFLAGRDRVHTVPAQGWPGTGTFDAAVEIACDGAIPDPSERFPNAARDFRRVADAMERVRTVPGHGCVRTFRREP